MKKYECDVVVVGAGPGGSMAAKYAALGGLKVLLLEKKAEIGSPLRCAEGVSKKWLSEIGVTPDPAWICADMAGAIIISPSGHRFQLDESKAGAEVGYVLERHLFDKALARQAADAGAKIMMRTSCRDVIRKDGKLVGIKADEMGEPVEIYAKCIVAADGFESQVARWAGIDTSLEMKDIDTCIQYRMTNIDIDPHFCVFQVGSAAPGGYIWIFPKGDGIANVGIGVQAKKCKHGADPKYYLDKYIANDPALKDGQIVEIIGGGVSTCPGLEDGAIADNIVLVGDAARIIDPITGGGIAHACRTGMYAGKVLAECAKKGDFSKKALQPYEKMWRDRMEDKLYRNWMAKERFASLSDDVLDDLVKMIGDSDIGEVNVLNLLKVIKEKYPQVVEGFEDLI